MKTALITIALLLSASLPLQAEIYQVTGKDGRKTFTNVAPLSEEDSNVEKVDLKETNISHETDHPADNDAYFESMEQENLEHDEISQRLNADQQKAYDALQQAKEQLEQAKEIRSGDYYNIPGKGLRYNEAYHQRIQHAEQRLQAAQENYDRIMQRAPASDTSLPDIDELFPEPQ